MFNKSSDRTINSNLFPLIIHAIIFIIAVNENYGFAHGYPLTSTANWFSRINNVGEKSGLELEAEKSFQQFINSKSGVSTEIGQIKPNASELDILMLKNKIANTILKMKELEKTPMAVNANQAECYIEVTKVERIPGKCHKVSNGLPVCQSDNYLSLNSECN